ncbi:MAG: CvpA family protein [Deferribacteraceae bacterium]|jgi:uncharacterized membrane protein required for colicin V production|nr:CvpA family protein [Deferribacteraceae bacterium]
MGVIDIVCLIILVLWLLLGLKRGFIYEILCIAVTVLVFVLTYIVHPMLTDIVGKIATPSAALNHIVFIISFVVVC